MTDAFPIYDVCLCVCVYMCVCVYVCMYVCAFTCLPLHWSAGVERHAQTITLGVGMLSLYQKMAAPLHRLCLGMLFTVMVILYGLSNSLSSRFCSSFVLSLLSFALYPLPSARSSEPLLPSPNVDSRVYTGCDDDRHAQLLDMLSVRRPLCCGMISNCVVLPLCVSVLPSPL
jgi:hypothetical protein